MFIHSQSLTFLDCKTSCRVVCIIACGNFALASSSAGQINMWNMQSGVQRKSYTLGPCPPNVAAQFDSGAVKCSDRTITELATNSLNSVVIASAVGGTLSVSLDAVPIIYAVTDTSIIQFFDFQTTNWNLRWCYHQQLRKYCYIITVGPSLSYVMTWLSVSWILKPGGLSESWLGSKAMYLTSWVISLFYVQVFFASIIIDFLSWLTVVGCDGFGLCNMNIWCAHWSFNWCILHLQYGY